MKSKVERSEYRIGMGIQSARSGPPISRWLMVVVLTACITFEQGCYHTRINAKGEPATDYRKETIHTLAWGLVQENPEPDDCLSGTLDEVRVSTNFGYCLITVATLGFWCPMEVEWRCAKVTPATPVEE